MLLERTRLESFRAPKQIGQAGTIPLICGTQTRPLLERMNETDFFLFVLVTECPQQIGNKQKTTTASKHRMHAKFEVNSNVNKNDCFHFPTQCIL